MPEFAEDRLSLVVRGEDRLGAWELRDGPHPVPQLPDAIGYELVLLPRDGHGNRNSAVVPPLRAGVVAITNGTAAGVPPIGYLDAQCSPAVRSVRVHFDDGSVDEVPTVLSRTTGVRWMVCPLDSPRAPIRMDFVNAEGNVLESGSVEDPRSLPEPDAP